MKSVRLILLTAAIGCAGCSAVETISNIGASIGESTGVISSREAQAVRTTGKAAGKASERITPEQEYYIGRSVGAAVLSRYPAYDNTEANRYVNLIGQTLAAASDRPQTFRGYHFLVLDSDEINAFAAPGGFVFVSRGILRCCGDEDEVAAVLAHEVAHAQLQHGIRAIKASRITSAVKVGLSETAKTYGGEQVTQLTEVFEDTIGDILSTMLDSGYSRKTEHQADRAAIDLMQRIGYDPAALEAMLKRMKKQLVPGSHGFGSTHPSPKKRIKEIDELRLPKKAGKTEAARNARFTRAMAGI